MPASVAVAAPVSILRRKYTEENSMAWIRLVDLRPSPDGKFTSVGTPNALLSAKTRSDGFELMEAIYSGHRVPPIDRSRPSNTKMRSSGASRNNCSKRTAGDALDSSSVRTCVSFAENRIPSLIFSLNDRIPCRRCFSPFCCIVLAE